MQLRGRWRCGRLSSVPQASPGKQAAEGLCDSAHTAPAEPHRDPQWVQKGPEGNLASHQRGECGVALTRTDWE